MNSSKKLLRTEPNLLHLFLELDRTLVMCEDGQKRHIYARFGWIGGDNCAVVTDRIVDNAAPHNTLTIEQIVRQGALANLHTTNGKLRADRMRSRDYEVRVPSLKREIIDELMKRS